MQTPVLDFLNDYIRADMVRAHMPGHKGRPVLGFESLDITEVRGADALYTADGILGESEKNAAALFGTQATFYSTEGSSHCVRSMLALCVQKFPGRRLVLAARNAHRSLIDALALLDLDPVWMWPETPDFSLCSCPVSAIQTERALSALPEPPLAVYLTSPDYLGGTQDIASIAAVCHRHDVPLLVDNAHGAYLRFLHPSCHPMQLGADLCCDSAHKTLPVLTGGAYLHISRRADPFFAENARRMMALFGSTSPSYLTMASLDAANRYLADELPGALPAFLSELDVLRDALCRQGWHFVGDEPLRLTVRARDAGYTGTALADCLRAQNIECEYADPDFTVLMLTPGNSTDDLHRITAAFAAVPVRDSLPEERLYLEHPARVCSVRHAVLSPARMIPAEESAGRILAAPTVACPPAISIVVSGERIPQAALLLFRRFGIQTVSVLV